MIQINTQNYFELTAGNGQQTRTAANVLHLKWEDGNEHKRTKQ